MSNIHESFPRVLPSDHPGRDPARRHSRSWRCRCGNHIFFRNTMCLKCGSPLGYLPERGELVALDPGSAPDRWRAAGEPREVRRCANLDTPAGCNWLLDADEPQTLCIACRLNRTIPHLGDADNRRYWAAIEQAKRRLVSQLLALGLPVRSRIGEDPQRGLMFDFLRSDAGGSPVTTGHAHGLITIDVEEADDAKRERMRHALHEPYRTLLGHFRHEIGHYYWDRLVRDSQWLAPFRRLFGDERADYAAALQAHRDRGPPSDWATRYISAYASTHPWEDWAETWAHYLHVVDSLGTAAGFGLDPDDLEAEAVPFTRADLHAPEDPDADRFLALLNGWIEVTMVLNELAQSMGQPDFYPFVMSRPVVAKLQFVHLVVRDA
jgi:hypothetical protein